MDEQNNNSSSSENDDKYREPIESGSFDIAAKLPPLDIPKSVPTADNSPVKTVRTLETDVAEHVEQGLSLSDVLLAESKQRERSGQEPAAVAQKHYSQFFIIVGAILVVVIATSVAIFGLNKKNGTSLGSSALLAPAPIIFLNSAKSVDLSGKDNQQTIDQLESERSGFSGILGSVEGLYFLSTDTQGKKYILTSTQFLTILSQNVPDNLLRSLDDNFVYGIHAFDGNQPFIVLKENYYENAFAGMLAWEPSMEGDLNQIFKQTKPALNTDSNGTVSFIDQPQGATDTISTATLPGREAGFQDVVIKNHDARAIFDQTGNILLVYSFFDQNTIVITNNENTLTEAFDRLSGTRPLQ